MYKIVYKSEYKFTEEELKELLEDTDCIIEILPKEFSNWKY